MVWEWLTCKSLTRNRKRRQSFSMGTVNWFVFFFCDTTTQWITFADVPSIRICLTILTPSMETFCPPNSEHSNFPNRPTFNLEDRLMFAWTSARAYSAAMGKLATVVGNVKFYRLSIRTKSMKYRWRHSLKLPTKMESIQVSENFEILIFFPSET